MKVLVTGGGGFLGSAIVRRLLARGDSVSILGRSAQPELAAEGVTVHCGDISDYNAVLKASEGAEAVIHTAAKAGVWGRSEDYYATNVTGTRNVLKACFARRIRYLVHTSTPSVVYTGESFEGADESLPYGQNFTCAYARTKAEAEQLVLSAYDVERLRVCALRPHLIWGVGDPHLLPRVIDRARKGRLAIVGDGSNLVDITHVDNAALAHVLALDALRDGRAGGRAYFISQGKPVALWPWINDLAVQLGLDPVERAVSASKARKIGAVLELLWRGLHLKGEPPMTRFTAVELSHSHWFNIGAAVEDLGYSPEVSTEDGLAKYIEQYKAQMK